MKTFSVSLQAHNYKTVKQNVTQSDALSFLKAFDWSEEVSLFQEKTQKIKECCPPGLFFEFEKTILSIQTEDGKSFEVGHINGTPSSNKHQTVSFEKAEKELSTFLEKHKFVPKKKTNYLPRLTLPLVLKRIIQVVNVGALLYVLNYINAMSTHPLKKAGLMVLAGIVLMIIGLIISKAKEKKK